VEKDEQMVEKEEKGWPHRSGSRSTREMYRVTEFATEGAL
jgi:hypothetical protein